MKLAWNAILRNEAARIARCVNSLLPHIDCAIVVDTGSTDDTVAKVVELFAAAGKSLELHYRTFDNFERSRNDALAHARASVLDWDYLLLSDADMELRLTRPFQLNGGMAYDMRQAAGTMSYWNRRLLSRKSDALFAGVTHEYLDVASAGPLDNAYFIDHADGSNRANKVVRDIALLEAGLKTETRPGLIERYHFYLAQSYRDAGNWELAAYHYWKRLALSGFDEECWYARLQYALCHKQLGDERVFLWEMLQAYNMRPQRAETLHELAKFFRIRGENHASLLFSRPALALPKSKDMLFVDVYSNGDGVREEFGICAYYDPSQRQDGAAVTDGLALRGSEQARFNVFWYLQPLSAHVPSFSAQPIAFDPPAGWVAMNPSVINNAGQPEVLVRTVNYTISADGRYEIRGGDGRVSDAAPINTRSFIGTHAGRFIELTLPLDWPEPKYRLVRGFEDSRLFEWDGRLWTLSTVRELTPEGWCEQVLAPVELLDPYNDRVCYGAWTVLKPFAGRHEKNWMPFVRGHDLRFVYRLGTLLDAQGKVILDDKVTWDVSHISGGSQVIEIDSRTYLALVHEARFVPGRPNRYYQHRFAVFDQHDRLDALSAPFFFFDRQIEFVAGLAYFSDKRQVMASFGVRDCEAWTATMDVDEVIKFVYRDVFRRDCP
jgi:glycosyltransferase involved in cell wall biosynthesis